MNEYNSGYYYRPATPVTHQPIGAARYIHRARQVKTNDPNGVYAVFNLSSNKKASDKPSIDKGSALFG
jgi:hypothetical protein